jgi:DNA-binding response OmpR family regulator
MHLLLVEDHKDIAENIKEYFVARGANVEQTD